MASVMIRDYPFKELQSNDELELLNAIDNLRSKGLSRYVSLPQLIVCGDQSSGKSSVLEANSGMPFPIKSNLCTCFATEFILRRAPQIHAQVSIVPNKSRSESQKQYLSTFHEVLDA